MEWLTAYLICVACWVVLYGFYLGASGEKADGAVFILTTLAAPLTLLVVIGCAIGQAVRPK